MATTWIKAIHKSGGGMAATLDRSVDYIGDGIKTERGQLVDSFMCDPRTAQSEFLLSKRLYEQRTGRSQGKRDVIGYHIRMSFAPGEVTPQQALELGMELAARWTKNKHQYIVAAHSNTNSPHVHIFYNSVNLEATGKYHDFKRSAIALRRVSDQICLENGLSIIEKPGLSKGYNRSEYLGENKPPTIREQLRAVMDSVIPACKSFEDFLAALKDAGVEIKQGKQLAFKMPKAKRFTRQDTLGDDYSLEAILERISGKRIVAPKEKMIAPPTSATKPNLLIDIEEKLRQGKGGGYEHWARIFNLKEMSKTLIYLQENGLDDYDALVKTTAAVCSEYEARNKKARSIDKRLGEIQELQKQIKVYGKTREAYIKYRKSGWDKDFFEACRADITLHQAAKNYFDSLGYGKNKKLPPMDELKKEFATLTAEKKRLYSGYKELNERRKDLLIAKGNAERILGIGKNTPAHEATPNRQRDNSHSL